MKRTHASFDEQGPRHGKRSDSDGMEAYEWNAAPKNNAPIDESAALNQLQRQAEHLRQTQKPMEAAALEFHMHIIERTRRAIRRWS